MIWRDFGDECTSQVTSYFNPMNKHNTFCGSPEDLQPLDLTHSPEYTQCPAQGSLEILTALCCTTSLNPNLHLNCSKGRKTPHSPAVIHLAPRTSSSTPEERTHTKPMIQSTIKSRCPPADTPALSGESVLPQYLRHLTVFFNSSSSRGVMGHKLFRKYQFPS